MSIIRYMRASVRKYRWIIGAVLVAIVLLCAAAVYAAGSDGQARRTADVPVRAALADYGWDELAAIADEVGACDDQAGAIAVAARYGLCAADGMLDGTQAKEIAFADGLAVRAQLAGIWHDDRADGGKAGLTFVFADAAGEHAMNHAFEDARSDAPDSTGGWGASDMRAWLNGDFLMGLPADMRSCIVAVQKKTASRVGSADELDEAGHLAGGRADWVDQTADRVWLLSAAEIFGDVPLDDSLGVDETMTAIYAGEGAQYRLFADAGAKAFEPNDALVRTQAGAADGAAGGQPCTWWLRTKTLEFGDGFWLVGTDGTPLNGLGEDARAAQDPEYAPDELWGPDHARGVVAGFCL